MTEVHQQRVTTSDVGAKRHAVGQAKAQWHNAVEHRRRAQEELVKARAVRRGADEAVIAARAEVERLQIELDAMLAQCRHQMDEAGA